MLDHKTAIFRDLLTSYKKQVKCTTLAINSPFILHTESMERERERENKIIMNASLCIQYTHFFKVHMGYMVVLDTIKVKR